MKRLIILLLAPVVAVIVAAAPLSVTVSSNGLVASVNTASAAPSSVTENVFCKDGITSGYTNDPVVFCKNAGGPADVSSGNRPYACVDKSVQTGPDAATACAKHKGGAVAAANAANGPCGPDSVQIAIVFPGGSNCVSNDPATGGAIVAYLKVLLKYLSTLVGMVVILMIVIGGIQYIVSAGDPTQIKNAKNRIINAIVALVLYLSAFAILSLIIPGGIA